MPNHQWPRILDRDATVVHETNKQLSEAVFEQVARIGKAVANPKRLELLELLSQSPRTVESLARETAMSQANTSQHLKALRTAHLVKTTRDGTSVWYRLTDDTVADFFRALRVLAITHLAELDRIVRSEEHTSELQSRSDLVCRLLLEKKKIKKSFLIIID